MLSRLKLRNIKSFGDLDLRLNVPRKGEDGWTVLVGSNGTGKSTLLQGAVVGILDPRPITNLVPAPWRFVRSGAKEGSIEVRLGRTTSRRVVKAAEGSYFAADGVSLAKPPLLLGLSARRRLARQGELFTPENAVLNRVEGLFATDHGLLTQDPFAVFETKRERTAFARVVAQVITHELEDGTRMFPLVDYYELRGKGGVQRSETLLGGRRFVLRYGEDYVVRVAVEELSDGYQAMLALVLEVLAQAALHTRRVPDPKTLEALVLIDEIEAHLHPKWQRSVVPLLRSAFPRCQFVVTTHSPLVVAAAREGEVRVLDVRPEGEVVAAGLEDLPSFDVRRIYEEVFGVMRSGDPEVIEKEREYLHRKAAALPVDPELEAFVEAAWSTTPEA